jgi:MoaA/NifB/PqqE/SkfB family radical SAM enzyme
MKGDLQKWQRSIIRNNMAQYREALRNYYIKDKPVVEVSDGYTAFSLLSPPLGSAAARRRIRFIMNNIIDRDTSVRDDGTVSWGSRTPHFITIAVTYKCQCDCLHCSAYLNREQTKRNGNALTVAQLKSAIKQAVDLGTTSVILTGGEPLLHERICDLVRTVDKSKSICSMFTNGEFLSGDIIRKLKRAGLFGVFVSLDHSEPQRHNENRGRKELFEKAVRGIKLCQEHGILTGISTYITREKLCNGELDAMMELGKNLNVLEVFLFDIIATGRLDGKQGCMLNEKEVEQIQEFRKKYNVRPDYPRIIHQTMFTSIAYPCAAEGCPGGVAQMHLRADGDVAPCDFTPFSFGNIRRNSLRQLWHAITSSEIYSKSSRRCRLSDPAFWAVMEKCDTARRETL